MSELLPCPFCGAAAQWWKSPLVEEDPQDEGGRYECSDALCGVHTDVDFPSEWTARDVGNRRSPPAPAIDVEAVVAALWDDVTDRRGIKHEFNQCDADVKDEIRAAWSKIIRAALGGKEQQ